MLFSLSIIGLSTFLYLYVVLCLRGGVIKLHASTGDSGFVDLACPLCLHGTTVVGVRPAVPVAHFRKPGWMGMWWAWGGCSCCGVVCVMSNVLLDTRYGDGMYHPT